MSSDRDTELREAGEDERGDHGAFSNRGGHALRRAVADVTCGEEPYAARLERQRIAIECPAFRRVAGCEEILSGQDVAGGIGEDVLARTPVGVWATADAEEDAVHRALSALPAASAKVTAAILSPFGCSSVSCVSK
jgi:hypothetical protein